MSHADDPILHSLGLPSDDERASVERQLANGTADPADFDPWRSLVAWMDDDAPVAPPSGLLDRIRRTATVQREDESMVDKVAGLLGDTARRARYLLRMLHAPDPWIDLFPGCRLMHVRPGPAIAGPRMDVGFVSLDAGVTFPEHEHIGDERVLIVSGTLIDGITGERFGPGSLVDQPAGSSHDVRASEGGPVVYLVVIRDGVLLFGTPSEEPPDEFVW